MDLTALKPDEAAMLRVTLSVGTGALGEKEAHVDGLYRYWGDSLLHSPGYVYEANMCWCSQLPLQSYCLDTLRKTGGKLRMVAFPAQR